MSEKSLMPMAANVLGMNFDQLVLTILATAKN
jgi:D-alanine-D-alanine ligase-like ATP-grasp enzyme